MAHLTGKKTLEALGQYEQYINKTPHYIKKRVGEQINKPTKKVTVDDLNKHLASLQSSEQPIKPTHALSYIASLNIDYLSTLDYVDLKNLCQTSQDMKRHVCDNNALLKQILVNSVEGNIQLPVHFDLIKPLNELYQNILDLVLQTWPLDQWYPKWVNKELLVDDMIRHVYMELFYRIEDMIYHQSVDNVVKQLQQFTIFHVNKAILTFPLVPVLEVITEYELEIHRSVYDTENHLIIPPSLTNYLIHVIMYWLKTNDDIDDNHLQALLFIRPGYRLWM